MSSLDGYFKMLERLNKPLSSIGFNSPSTWNMFSPVSELINMHETFHALQHSPFQEYVENYKTWNDSLNAILKSPFEEASQPVISTLRDSITLSFLSARTIPAPILQRHNYDSVINNHFNATLQPLLSTISVADDFDESDYVIVDEPHIKEICLPDNLIIPIGNYRFKIRTDIFLSIISLILSVVLSLVSSAASSASAAKSEEERLHYEQIQTEALLWQNEMLRDLLQSVDTSCSSQTEAIKELQEAVEANTNALEDPEESVDNVNTSANNVREK